MSFVKGHAVVSRPADWSTPEDIKDQVQKMWRRGVILAEVVRRSGFFPRRLVLRRPTAGQLVSRIGEARSWSTALRDTAHVRVTLRDFTHPILGPHTIAHHVWVDSVEDAAALIGKDDRAELFRHMVGATMRQQPQLVPWLHKRPMRALRVAEHWQSLLDATTWLQAHPRPGVYLQQVDVPGLDGQFLEQHRVLLMEILDAALPPGHIDATAKRLPGFNKRYGFRDRPQRIRLRVLDREHNLLAGDNDQDVTLDATTFASVETGAKSVFITESEINFLTLPSLPDSVAILAAPRDFNALTHACWLRNCQIYYWGDIDTRSFVVLAALRRHFEHARSLLMDRDTLLACRTRWVEEKTPVQHDVANLTAPEQALYDDLRYKRLAPAVRLSQERISFAWVRKALADLDSCHSASDGVPLVGRLGLEPRTNGLKARCSTD